MYWKLSIYEWTASVDYVDSHGIVNYWSFIFLFRSVFNPPSGTIYVTAASNEAVVQVLFRFVGSRDYSELQVNGATSCVDVFNGKQSDFLVPGELIRDDF